MLGKIKMVFISVRECCGVLLMRGDLRVRNLLRTLAELALSALRRLIAQPRHLTLA